MSHDDFAFEPVRGLPERPPEDEQILWQGRPSGWRLAVEALNFWWIAGYFVLLAGWRTIVAADTLPLWEAVRAGSPFLVMGAVACAILWLIAVVQARATV